jgi:hypothetical protein
VRRLLESWDANCPYVAAQFVPPIYPPISLIYPLIPKIYPPQSFRDQSSISELAKKLVQGVAYPTASDAGGFHKDKLAVRVAVLALYVGLLLFHVFSKKLGRRICVGRRCIQVVEFIANHQGRYTQQRVQLGQTEFFALCDGIFEKPMQRA